VVAVIGAGPLRDCLQHLTPTTGYLVAAFNGKKYRFLFLWGSPLNFPNK